MQIPIPSWQLPGGLSALIPTVLPKQYQQVTYLDNVGDALVIETLHKGLQGVTKPWHQ